jgi:hypothetical protein
MNINTYISNRRNRKISNQHIGEYTWYRDKNGKKLYVGDFVRFYFSADVGYGDKASGFTEMVDVVLKIDDNYALFNSCGGAAFIWRHNKFCRKIGTIIKNKDIAKKYFGWDIENRIDIVVKRRKNEYHR